MKTLEEYLKENYDRTVIDHTLRVDWLIDGKPKFYIHPSNTSGDTIDFLVEGNSLIPVVNGVPVR